MYEEINLYVKNEPIIHNNEVTEPIVIGKITMPINILLENKDTKDNCFTGKIRLKLKEKENIGYLNINVKYITPNFDEFSFKNNQYKNNIEENELDNEWSYFYYSYTKIKKSLVERFFLFKGSNKLESK